MNNNSYEEIREHGNVLLPLKVYYAILGQEIADVYLHWHKEIELIYIKSGKGTFQIDLNSYQVEAGDILIINSETLHSGKPEIYCECETIVFHPNLLRAFEMNAGDINYIHPIIRGEILLPAIVRNDSSLHEEIFQAHQSLINLYEAKKTGFELAIRGILLQMLAVFFREEEIIRKSIERANNKNEKLERLHRVIEFVENNYKREISIQEISNYIGITEFYFCRFFKAMTLHTFSEYVNAYRINKAVQLLLTTNMSITEIALESGFENISYFIRVFKKSKKLSPYQFRKKQKNLNK